MRRLLPFGLLLAACATTPPPPPTPPVKEPGPSPVLKSADFADIERLEDARVDGNGVLQGLTRDANPAIRRRALRALGRLQHARDLPIVAAALSDLDAQTREEAAFALGQFGVSWEPLAEADRALAEDRLLEVLGGEKDPAVRDRALEALGKVAGQKAVDALTDVLSSPSQVARAAIALGLAAKTSNGKLVSPRAIGELVTPLKDGTPEMRFAAAWALMRFKEPSTRGMLLGCLSDSDANVRAACVKGLADVGIDTDVPHVAKLLDDPDERVAAEAGRTLAKLAIKCADAKGCAAVEALNSPRDWTASMVAAITFEPVLRADFAAVMRARMDGVRAEKAPLALSTSGRVHCQLAFAHDRAVGRIETLPACGLKQVPPTQQKVLSARALGAGKGSEDKVKALTALAKDPDAKVRAAAAEALGNLDGGADVLGRLLADEDGAVVGAAADSVEKRKLAQAGPALVKALERLDPVRDLEALQAVLSAAGALELKDASARATALAEQPNAALASAARKALAALGSPPAAKPAAPIPPGPYAAVKLPPRPVVRLETTRGVVRIRLLVEEAPMTCRNFLSLVGRGFYDGLTFHRVVPNFVAQGGDPRGDGSGGPGYTIRCEVNPVRYAEGSVGMALSGKDTGGSQFFVALSPQPHLDGRYTVFGEVVEGLANVRALVEGDRIEKATLE